MTWVRFRLKTNVSFKSIRYKEGFYWGKNWRSEKKRIMEIAKSYGFRLSWGLCKVGGNIKNRKATMLEHPATVSTMKSKKWFPQTQMHFQTSIPLRCNARKYCWGMVHKSYYDARKQRINIKLAQRSTLFAYRFRKYHKIPTYDLALDSDQWTHQKRKKGRRENQKPLATVVLKFAAFLPFIY